MAAFSSIAAASALAIGAAQGTYQVRKGRRDERSAEKAAGKQAAELERQSRERTQSEEQKAAQEALLRRRRLISSQNAPRRASILTGPLGVPGGAATTRPSLIGY